MRSKTIVSLILVASSSVLASATTAQQPSQPLPGQQQQQSANPAVPGQRPMGPGGMGMGAGMMNPDMMRMLGPMFERSQDTGRRGGPLQRVSRLLAALDDSRARTALGLTDQQADSLRKIIVDTETFTIKTAADVAVNSIELRELLRADKPDRTAVTSKGDQISKSTSLLINHYLDAMLAAKALLTPEQQRMIRAYMERGAPALPALPPPPTRP
jgi:Spy/CpxP family protein refolding chaperone